MLKKENHYDSLKRIEDNLQISYKPLVQKE